MRFSNVIMIGIAIACASLAALLSRAWLVSQSAKAPAAIQAEIKPKLSIAIVAHDVKYGDKLTEKNVKLAPWPSDALPRGAFTDLKTLLSSGNVAVLREMTQGEPVLGHKLIGGENDNSLPGKLTENMKAITIRVNDVAGVAGFVQPEDRVDVFLTYSKDQNKDNPAIGSSVVVLLQNIRVLAVDQTTSRADQPTPANAVTLEVNTQEAQKLTLASSVGNLSLALNRLDGKSAVENISTLSFDDIVNQGRIMNGAPLPEGETGPVVTVTRSVERKNYAVPQDNRSDESWQHQILSHQGQTSNRNDNGTATDQ
ncbi:MAG: Flp pilus assembly protein CpaB [Hyphomicrobiales bacterium]|nr:Flp pilus assembly protein CpaB [Hyphomicrobiales bacterium]